MTLSPLRLEGLWLDSTRDSTIMTRARNCERLMCSKK